MNSYVSKYKIIMHVHSTPSSGAAEKTSTVTENCRYVLVMVAGMRHEGSKTLPRGLLIQVQGNLTSHIKLIHHRVQRRTFVTCYGSS